MYRIIQFIRHKIPFFWIVIEYLNQLGFLIRFGGKRNKIENCVSAYNNEQIIFEEVKKNDVTKLTSFFSKQPENAFTYFNPHKFDEQSVLKLVSNPAFIMLQAKVNNEIVGYAFMRCFVNGKSFRGKIVDIDHRGMGIAKKFGLITMEIAQILGLRLFGTISNDNAASLASSKACNRIKIIQDLPDGYKLIEYLPKV